MKKRIYLTFLIVLTAFLFVGAMNVMAETHIWDPSNTKMADNYSPLFISKLKNCTKYKTSKIETHFGVKIAKTHEIYGFSNGRCKFSETLTGLNMDGSMQTVCNLPAKDLAEFYYALTHPSKTSMDIGKGVTMRGYKDYVLYTKYLNTGYCIKNQ